MREANFSAFLPRDRFTESFCANEEEREIHRGCAREVSKMLLARQEPRLWWESKVFYRSAFLDGLKERRDAANGCDGTELRTRFPDEPWRQELDPCRANLTHARLKSKSSYDLGWNTAISEEAQRLAGETKSHASGLSREYSFDPEGRHAFLQRVLARDAAALEFTFDQPKSTLGYSVFSKSVLADLDICWTLEEVDGLVGKAAEGHYRPSLQLRRPNVRGRLSRAATTNPVNLLIINYAAAVDSFSAAYWKFRNLDELETIARAHLCLYGYLAPLIEAAARESFA